ncbi:ABC transporter ATP-binding protein [Paenibacillus elgii]|uniref:ABC transporter ATP-binding protein n=1 Tax=Paenibacillus elgii TaxID=189691 RepID=UPI000FD6766E|nr:ABC transporter ATP-binding protein [Paenibacillus elgii]NEN86553.1 ABC transporter ATP-binding protein [Paenibacillus elgii]
MAAKSVTLKQVTKAYAGLGTKQPSNAVSDVNLVIEEGQFATLLGPSGCGKTTTLRMIAGFEEITSGEILFGEQPVNEIPPNKRDCTMVFQSYALFPHLNVWDNVAYGLKIKKFDQAVIREKVSRVLEIMNLNEYKERMPSQMSGGQQQRVALARALVMEPSVLLFDEPLSNLDAKLRIVMRDEIRRIQRTLGITAVYVTHDQSEAMYMSDVVIVMNKGRIEQIGTPQEIYQRPKTKFVADFIGSANFVEGKVVRVVEDRLEIDTPMGIMVAANHAEVTAGQQVALVIRPESAVVLKTANNNAVITKSVFMGQTQEYEIDFGGKMFQVTQHNPIAGSVFSTGEHVTLEFPEHSIQVVPA